MRLITKTPFMKKMEENGFIYDMKAPVFQFRKELIDPKTIKKNNLNPEDVPCVLYGQNPMNSGFCIYTGYCFVWIDATTPKQAVKFAKKIICIESIMYVNEEGNAVSSKEALRKQLLNSYIAVSSKEALKKQLLASHISK